VAVGLLGWAASVLLTGLFVVPLLAGLQGISLRDLASTEKTEYILAVQAWETVQGIAVIWACVRSFLPLPPDLFRIDRRVLCSPCCVLLAVADTRAQLQALFAGERVGGVGLAGLRRHVRRHRRRCRPLRACDAECRALRQRHRGRHRAAGAQA
jgi:hypothetical protein